MFNYYLIVNHKSISKNQITLNRCRSFSVSQSRHWDSIYSLSFCKKWLCVSNQSNIRWHTLFY